MTIGIAIGLFLAALTFVAEDKAAAEHQQQSTQVVQDETKNN